MKKLLSLTLALLLLFTLAACGGSDSGGGSDSSGGSSSAGSGEVQAEDGYAEARTGDLVHSYFMDFTVNSAYTTGDYHGHTAPEGMKVLVVNMSIKNTFKRKPAHVRRRFSGPVDRQLRDGRIRLAHHWTSPSPTWSSSTTTAKGTPSSCFSPPRSGKRSF